MLASRVIRATTKASFSLRTMSSIKYAKSHEYIKVSGNIGTIGITKHAADALGDIVFVDLPTVGSVYDASDSFGSVESVKTASDVYVPVAGEVVEVNDKLTANPELVNESPLEEGWFIKIKINNASELENLLEDAQYQKHVEEEEH